ncbi:acetoacetyl-CoA reductase [Sinimarinibacterium thermocellulolyticum]|uniref:Acetoacetyl-CoA reductase n=1 Tax=Sinimarinibacterium thermocellulolyticum TaxID=3170016 RepID=A0ABV2AC91_9GAMM
MTQTPPPAAPRTAIVTGGTGAIGSAICRALAAAGLEIVAIGHPAEGARIPAWRQDLSASGVDVAVELADLADAEAAAAAMQRACARLKAVDVLVNAAGITRDARFVKMTPEQWRAVLSSNLDSVFFCTRAVFADMCVRGFGRIVNIASVNGQKGQFGQANYAAAKAGMHGLTMSLALEGARHGVTVNTVSPGYVRTPMTAAIKPEVLQRIVAQIPLGRMAEPEEIARVVAFLCARESAYITGANLPVNGGLYMSA